MGIACFGLNLILQKNKPPTPPSESGNLKREPFIESMKKVIRKKNFILLLIQFGCYFGIFNAISITLSYLINPWFGGKNLPLAVAAVGGSPILSGIIGIIVFGTIQKKTGKYKRMIQICMCGTFHLI